MKYIVVFNSPYSTEHSYHNRIRVSSSFRLIACMLVLFCTIYGNVYAQQVTSKAEIPETQLLQPVELVKVLKASSGEKPLILQVGPQTLYNKGHIPGAEYIGATREKVGLNALRNRVKSLDRTQFLVIYCGCCPWNDCPNIRVAYNELSSLGFTHVKVLYLANNFGTDWTAKSYPVANGN